MYRAAFASRSGRALAITVPRPHPIQQTPHPALADARSRPARAPDLFASGRAAPGYPYHPTPNIPFPPRRRPPCRRPAPLAQASRRLRFACRFAQAARTPAAEPQLVPEVEHHAALRVGRQNRLSEPALPRLFSRHHAPPPSPAARTGGRVRAARSDSVPAAPGKGRVRTAPAPGPGTPSPC